jgi:hypothetical protein
VEIFLKAPHTKTLHRKVDTTNRTTLGDFKKILPLAPLPYGSLHLQKLERVLFQRTLLEQPLITYTTLKNVVHKNKAYTTKHHQP